MILIENDYCLKKSNLKSEKCMFLKYLGQIMWAVG